MNRIFGTHPALGAFLLGGGAFFAAYFGYKVLGPDAAQLRGHFDSDLNAFWQWVLAGLGALMWLAGGIVFGFARGFRWYVALLLHLLPVVGLLLMAVLRRHLTPREAWERDNPGLDATTARRTYRPMKSLY